MIFTDNFNSSLIFFIKNIDSNLLKKFIIGFYQLFDTQKYLNYDFDIELIDEKKLQSKVVDFLDNVFILDLLEKKTPSEEIAFFLSQIALIYKSLMMTEESILFFKESIKIREEKLKVQHLETAENYQNLASIYEYGGAFNKAIGYYKKALEIRKELSFVENNLLVAESYGKLAVVYYYLEEYLIALNYIEKTIDIREKLLPENHKLLENSYHNYKMIKKELEPKNNYILSMFRTVYYILGSVFSRLVGQK